MVKKYVISGGPCCRKTTLIDKLKEQGFSVLEESAREILEQRKKFPVNEKENLIRQQLIFEKQLQKEEKSNEGDGILFLDRCLCEVSVYCKFLLNYIPENIANYNLLNRYEKVFFLDRYLFVDDGLRIEQGEEGAQKIQEIIYNTYKELGYNIIKIPKMDTEKRIEMILDYI